MDEKYAFDTIDAATFHDLLNEYPIVVPGKLADLKEKRLKVIPKAIQERNPPYITENELATLMDWKLSHGTFRPMLKKLIQQNDEAFVRAQTEQALTKLNGEDPAQVIESLKSASKLKGVGPATASLVLSAKDPENVPFFSDELYRWACWQNSTGWKQEIKYTEKSYKLMYGKVQEFRERLEREESKDVSALDVEQVAYVLGRRALGDGEGGKVAVPKKRKVVVTEVAKDADEANGIGSDGTAEPTKIGRTTRSSKRSKSG